MTRVRAYWYLSEVDIWLRKQNKTAYFLMYVCDTCTCMPAPT